MKSFIVLQFLWCLSFMAPVQAQNDHQDELSNNDRGRQLVKLSGVLGEMHHLRQICEPFDRPDMWRERMKELTTIESPAPVVRTKMIAAFNERYQAGKKEYSQCDTLARLDTRQLAVDGQFATRQLSAPFQGDTSSGLGEFSDENGVRVYRGTP